MTAWVSTDGCATADVQVSDSSWRLELYLRRSPMPWVPLSLALPCQLLPEVDLSGASLVRRPQVLSVSALPKLESSKPPLLRSPKPPPPSPDRPPNLEAPNDPPPPPEATDGLPAPQLSLISALEGPSSSRGGRSSSSNSRSRPPARRAAFSTPQLAPGHSGPLTSGP